MKKIAVGVAVLVVAGAGLWSMSRRPEPPAQAPTTAPETSGAEVKMMGPAVRAAPGMKDKAYFLSNGMTKEAMNNKKAALQDYNTAIKMDPKFADAYFQRGTLLSALGDCPRATKDLKKAANLKPVYKYQIQYYIDSCKQR